MNKEQEQEEAIERLNRFKTIEILYSNTFAMHIEQLKTLQEDIETVLSMLKEQQEENKKKDKIIDEMTEWISERCFYKDDYSNSCEIIQDSCYKDENCKDCIKQYFENKAEKE